MAYQGILIKSYTDSMAESSKLSLTGLHQLIILLSKMTSLRDDKKELGNGLLSQMNSSSGKTTKSVSYSAQEFLVQARQ
jgi:hypothetical protein